MEEKSKGFSVITKDWSFPLDNLMKKKRTLSPFGIYISISVFFVVFWQTACSCVLSVLTKLSRYMHDGLFLMFPLHPLTHPPPLFSLLKCKLCPDWSRGHATVSFPCSPSFLFCFCFAYKSVLSFTGSFPILFFILGVGGLRYFSWFATKLSCLAELM